MFMLEQKIPKSEKPEATSRTQVKSEIPLNYLSETTTTPIPIQIQAKTLQASPRPDMKLLYKNARLRIQEKFRERFVVKRIPSSKTIKKPKINIGSLEIERENITELESKPAQLLEPPKASKTLLLDKQSNSSQSFLNPQLVVKSTKTIKSNRS